MNDTEIKDMTIEQFIEMKKAMDDAENDTTPYAITTDDEQIAVVGDVNNTEITPKEYVVPFYYPNIPAMKERLKREGVEIENETPNYLVCRRTYKNVWIPPRVYTAVQTAFTEVYQFFNTVTDDGEIRDLTIGEMIEVMRMLSQDMIERMIHAVATILRIPREEEECVYSLAIPPIIMQMVRDFPEIINGVDFFTDKSSETQNLAIDEKQ